MKNWQAKLILLLIILFGGWLRFYHLQEPAAYIFDEVYHVPTIHLISQNDPRAYQWWHLELTAEYGPGAYIDWLHPPLAKLIQAVSLTYLGNQSLAWRLSSALAGTLLILVVYGLTKTLANGQTWPALIAAGLAAIDGLAIAQSRLAMNDIFVTLFVALAIWLYWLYQKTKHDRWLWLLVLATGLAIASKWSGVFILAIIATWQLWLIFVSRQSSWLATFALLTLVSCGALLIYLISYGQLLQHHSWSHLVELHRQIFNYQLHLDAEHPYSSRAWEWPLGLKPVYLYYDPVTQQQLWNRPFYPSWYLNLGCLIVGMIGLGYQWYQQQHSHRRQTSQRDFFIRYQNFFFLLLAYFWLWAPWIFSPRLMFFHHYLPALPCLWAISGLVVAKTCHLRQ